MFQCIIQQRNGWIHAPNPEMRDVFPGTYHLIKAIVYNKYENVRRILNRWLEKLSLGSSVQSSPFI